MSEPTVIRVEAPIGRSYFPLAISCEVKPGTGESQVRANVAVEWEGRCFVMARVDFLRRPENVGSASIDESEALLIKDVALHAIATNPHVMVTPEVAEGEEKESYKRMVRAIAEQIVAASPLPILDHRVMADLRAAFGVASKSRGAGYALIDQIAQPFGGAFALFEIVFLVLDKTVEETRWREVATEPPPVDVWLDVADAAKQVLAVPCRLLADGRWQEGEDFLLPEEEVPAWWKPRPRGPR